MGITYSFRLCVGFEIAQDDIKKCFLKEDKIPGKYHMEDRFDPKTGMKLKPVKVCDVKPIDNSVLIIDGEEIDPDDELEGVLEKTFNCHVETFGSYCAGELTYCFYLNKPVRSSNGGHPISIYNDSVDVDEVISLESKLITLKNHLQSVGLNVDKPRVFIAQSVG